MRLDEQGLKDKAVWEQAGYVLPRFDRTAVRNNTVRAPRWIHFGAGNIFRAFPAHTAQKLLERGTMDTGLIVAEGYDYEIIEKIYQLHDDYSILVTLKADGKVEKTVIGSIVEALTLNPENAADYGRLRAIFAAGSLQLASFTITEKGYNLETGSGEFLPAVAADFQNGPDRAVSYIGKIAALLYARFKAGGKPIALVSMDNCSRNGSRLSEAINTFARQWTANGLTAAAFAEYVGQPDRVSFPWTMIDKITPRPDAAVEAILKQDGVEAPEPLITARNTYVAPFVNAEEAEYLVIEEAFPNGRPRLEDGGILFTDRGTVEKVERMKVCTCLNPLHTALAVFGCLLGYTRISAEMDHPLLRRLVERIGYEEGIPVVSDPGIINPGAFIDTVLKTRFPNPFMPDTPQRIATDTSQKLAIRFGETVKAYCAAPDLAVESLKMIPLVFAGWLRYLMGVDDQGQSFAVSPDPLAELLKPHIARLRPGTGGESMSDESMSGEGTGGEGMSDKEMSDESISGKEMSDESMSGESISGKVMSVEAVENAVRPILANRDIFGINLYEAGLAEPVCRYLSEMLAGEGAVALTLARHVPTGA